MIAAYMAGLKDAYALAIALGGIAFLVAALVVLFDHKRLRVEQKETSNNEA